jgi:hypothetical protein
LPSPEPILTVSKDSKTSPPSFENDVPSPPTKLVPAVKISEKQPIEVKKKTSSLPLCSCFGQKSASTKEKTSLTIKAPKADLPEVEMPLPSSNISTTFKSKGPLRAPNNNLPEVNLTATGAGLPTLQKSSATTETEAVVPSNDIKAETSQPIEEVKVSSPLSFLFISHLSICLHIQIRDNFQR